MFFRKIYSLRSFVLDIYFLCLTCDINARSEQNTWEPVENMETCKHLLEAFEKQLARQKELKALRAQQQQQQHPVQVKF